jgi:hypothetical protein
MSETTPAASSTVEVDVFNGQTPTLAEFQQYREKGDVPERFKLADQNADAEPAATLEQTGETEGEDPEPAPDSDPEESQELKPKAAKRFQQILARAKAAEDLAAEYKRQLAEKQDAKPESSTTANNSQPQNYEQYRKTIKPREWIASYLDAHPGEEYEDGSAALVDHLADARAHFSSIESARRAQAVAFEAKVNDAKARYEDFDAVKAEFMSKIISESGDALIPEVVLGELNDSDVLTDLIHKIGSDEAEVSKFVALAKSNPAKAIRYLGKTEALIESASSRPRDDKGQFVPTSTAPERQKTAAPKPVSPVTGATSRAFDVSDENISENAWMAMRNKQLGKV